MRKVSLASELRSCNFQMLFLPILVSSTIYHAGLQRANLFSIANIFILLFFQVFFYFVGTFFIAPILV